MDKTPMEGLGHHSDQAVHSTEDTKCHGNETKTPNEALEVISSPLALEKGQGIDLENASPDMLAQARSINITPPDLQSSPNKPTAIPRLARRGLFASLTLLAEVDDPYLYPKSRKWFITFVVAFAAAATSLGSAIIYPALADTARDLHASPTVTNLSVALYMLSISFCPLWWSALSETAGRRTTYLVSLALFVLFAILSATARTIGVFVAMRMLSGGAGASVQAVGAGTLADIWEPFERGKAMGRFYMGPLCGPLLAPIIGGFLAARWGWRSTQWFLVIYGGVSLVFLLFALPETVRRHEDPSEDIAREADAGSSASMTRGRTKKYLRMSWGVLVDPLKMVLLLRHLPILFTAYWASLAFGTLYIVNISVQDVFAKSPYNFSVSKVGLTYIPAGFGFLISALFSGRWADHVMAREAKRKNRYDENGKLILRPEDRMMENAWIAAIAFPISMLWYGWSADKGAFWVVPLLATLVFGLSAMLIFGLAVTMLTEFVPRKPSSGVAVANFLRNIFSCIGTILAHPLIRAEGTGWMFTGLGILVSTGALVILWMRTRGSAWREANRGKVG
ncbi:hypothetical protein AYO21_10017 [Fonsecaea monophora]|uniref:Major facilitator superfamily (MFS) profile domain-containing protein n=1 Tax=Fonsecaea monophora TaxID=254056 RepID=A0A177EUS8_9EURO|nr:hypothetical protein AYO21_10017 [Fonsecaea monophora]KAH0830783.1 putative MFS multidrug resistance transporter [Fonsecaea pedrosoi]OAG35783.1 hypothetical protein AYO21_10017 [Fonsecaea monophora]